ncbi:MAG: EAL domain-containing protein [Thiohalomonadales bacterium]
MNNLLNIVQGISKQQIESITTQGDEGAFALDNSGVFLSMNKTAEKILGWTGHELQNKNFFSTLKFKLDTIAAIGTTRCEALQSVGCSHLQKGGSLTCKDTTVLGILFITIPIYDRGKVMGKVFIFSASDSRSITSQTGIHKQIIDNCSGLLIKLDLRGDIIFVNEYARSNFGVDIKRLLPANTKTLLKEDPEKLLNPTTCVNRCKNVKGEIRRMAWSTHAILAPGGELTGLVCIGNDISEIDQQRLAGMPEYELVQSVFQTMQEAVLTTDQQGLVSYLNPVAERLTGWCTEDARGLMLADVFNVVDCLTRKPMVPPLLVANANLLNKQPISAILLRSDQSDFSIEANINQVLDAASAPLGLVIVFRQLTESSSEQAWKSFIDKRDALTGLMASAEFELQVIKALASARNKGRQHALCIINVDSFSKHKRVYGEQSGEQLLKQIAMILGNNVALGADLARIGEDEFGLLLNNCSLQNARKSTQEICRCVADFDFENFGFTGSDNASSDCADSVADKQATSVKISISIGVIPLTIGGGGLAEAMCIVDTACFVAKTRGRNRVQEYNLLDLPVSERRSELIWIQKIRSALRDNRFRLYTQRIVPVESKATDRPHYEVLLRMQDDAGDTIRPGAFLPSAVRFHLMPAIDRWVVQQTLGILDDEFKKNKVVGMYSINLSAQSLEDENFLSFVIDAFDKMQFPAENICFEITESSAISNLMRATRFMSIVRGMGCRFSLDDFGRGFSSYAYLKNLPLDFLKIDGSFIRGLSNDPMNLAMVESINQIGHILGVQTIAEFVESEQCYEMLARIGVDHVQGYYMGKPEPMQTKLTFVKELQVVD